MTLDLNNSKHKLENWKLIRHEYLQLESKLAQWHRMFGDIILLPEQYKKIPVAATTHILATAHMSTLYWTACVIIYGMIGKILVENGRHDLLEGRYTDPSLFCTRILEITSLFMDPTVGLFRAHLITFPMSVTMIYLASLPPEDRLENTALFVKCLHNKSCATTRKFLLSLMPQNFKILLGTKI